MIVLMPEGAFQEPLQALAKLEGRKAKETVDEYCRSQSPFKWPICFQDTNQFTIKVMSLHCYLTGTALSRH